MTPPSGHRAFRRHLALTAALVTTGFLLMAALLLFVPIFAHLGTSELPADAAGGLAAYVLHLHESFWPVVLGALLASVASGLLLFERMRSPLVRFAATYRRLAAGEIPEPIELRTGDYLHDEARQLNDLVRAVADRRSRMTREIERLDLALAEIHAEATSAKVAGAAAEAGRALESLRRCVGGEA